MTPVLAQREWFTSDQHFGHRKVIDYCNRPYADVDDMNRALIARFNARVRSCDTTWHLGDFSLDEKCVRDVLPLLNGTHRLVAGNHDECFPGKHSGSHFKYVRRYHGFGFESITGVSYDREGRPVTDLLPEERSVYEGIIGIRAPRPRPWVDIERGGLRVRLCHFPADGDHTHEARYPEYRPTLDGCDVLLHGHVHDLFARRGKQINVGVDVRAFAPTSLEELLATKDSL